ncbi:MAG: hypothetical protein Q27BB25_00755 [Blastomonas sp. CACIA14H2]|nr:MAG: hypothetical protein Q27BB25_00755 [Blastomonas sp. CACIA14H2]
MHNGGTFSRRRSEPDSVGLPKDLQGYRGAKPHAGRRHAGQPLAGLVRHA